MARTSGPGSRGRDYGCAFIYALCDPRTGRVRYIGKARDPVYRWQQHRRGENCRGVRTHRASWLDSLRRDGLAPVLRILAVVTIEEWRAAECAWIAHAKALGHDLVNGTEGGDGLPDGFGVGRRNGPPERITVLKSALSREIRWARGEGAFPPDALWAASFVPYATAARRLLDLVRIRDGKYVLRSGVDQATYKAARKRLHHLHAEHAFHESRMRA